MDELANQSAAMNFARAADHFFGLAPERTAEIFSRASDVTIVVDSDGTIQDAAFAVPDVFNTGGRDWIGRKWADTVTVESRPKIKEILADSLAGRTIRAREINHLLSDGDDAPFRYSAARLDESGSVIAFGRDISRVATLQQKLINSQLSIEREFSRLRSAEMRYRMMFQLGRVPQVIVEASTLRICDVNPSALRTLGMDLRQVENSKVTELFESDNNDALEKLLVATIDQRTDEDVSLTLRGGEIITVRATYFQQERKGYVLLDLASDSGNVVPLTYAVERRILDLVDTMPDAFLITNDERRVMAVNSALVDLLNLNSTREAEGELLDSWFERAGVDCNVLFANVREHGSVRRFATVLRGKFGRTESVEIAATKLKTAQDTVYGFLIRSVSTPLAIGDSEPDLIPRSNEQITNLVGHMPLRDIVGETTKMIEQLCIEAALELTKGNRVSAARMLGLSRQSLYAKLARGNNSDD
ncbi:MAG: transcriptional regulator PpsR [Pseudomonadota bacterium]